MSAELDAQPPSATIPKLRMEVISPDQPLSNRNLWSTARESAARPPEFGEQTEEVLAEFGFGADEVARLRGAKVV